MTQWSRSSGAAPWRAAFGLLLSVFAGAAGAAGAAEAAGADAAGVGAGGVGGAGATGTAGAAVASVVGAAVASVVGAAGARAADTTGAAGAAGARAVAGGGAGTAATAGAPGAGTAATAGAAGAGAAGVVLPYPDHPGWYGDPAAPNLSGVWVRRDNGPAPAGVSPEGWKPWPPPLKGEFAATWKKRVKDAADGTRMDEPFRRCLPPGMPRFMSGMTSPLLIIQTPGRVTLYRDGSPVRRIYLDGRALPKLADREDFYNGNNIGHYDGKDLVTEVAGFKPLPIDGTGIPRSDQMTIQERFHRVDDQTLRVDITVRDPKALSKPMNTTVTYAADSDPLWEPHEFICEPEKNFHADMYVH